MPESLAAETAAPACAVSRFKAAVLQAAIRQAHLSEAQPLAGFIDVDGVGKTVENLVSAFPEHFRHTFAAKANAMSKALGLIRDHGLGCEVASSGELLQAVRAGFAPDQIVYDEPAKTRDSLAYVLREGINFNIDNFQEFDRVVELIKTTPASARIGFRINPQVGSGRIGAMSTATNHSKFGVALDDSGNRSRLIDCYRQHSWLTSLHTHIGSQGCSLELLVSGIRKVVDLADEINAALGHDQIAVIDIGGGLSVNFDSETVTPTFAEYAAALEAAVPQLFSGRYQVKTEFGRSILAKNGFIAARVEYTKESGGHHIAITHAGAQTATRTAFMPSLWTIRLGVFDHEGVPREGPLLTQDVGGPCCFAGDMLATERKLPRIEPGDYVMLHDTGAYYFSNPFFYNSLPACAVFGARETDDGNIQLDPWRQQQTLDELLTVIG